MMEMILKDFKMDFALSLLHFVQISDSKFVVGMRINLSLIL